MQGIYVVYNGQFVTSEIIRCLLQHDFINNILLTSARYKDKSDAVPIDPALIADRSDSESVNSTTPNEILDCRRVLRSVTQG